ncbi:MAG TPA: uroporphyrinogen decarboxylase [Gammaproteobacteria bacterium]|jgi:uroporphyrinogen decarboxylase|nr:uroporphyrinogen decarboxylase [Xanthomonadales bacterium]HOP21435.1 uroporphyrinogen decarboxylase [Gammaproteobacteria bacterium]MCB1594600.1 uroporphyrinogen decarboxylase [Xanthomonadales bacterium]MCB1604641.1 uroporphyrinogen decarboxylase [Xanthomonadales bacterium]HPI94655.1 uroporphyrinogen decarboxylase [Gammaproteobacteria bacterium]
MKLENDLLLRALTKQKTERTPVWVMRQAGRYLPEYREVRKKAGDFMTMAKNPEMVCEVTLQPLRRFPLDAVIIFSDILTIPDAMGMGLYFVTGEGPKFKKPISTAEDVDNLPEIDVNHDLKYVMDGISLTSQTLNRKVPLLGFCGSPWTLMTYMVEGGSSKNFSKAKSFLLNQPQASHKLLQKITDASINYLNAQIASGANAVQVFDSWGGALSPEMYRVFSMDYMQKIVQGVKKENPETPVILFSKGVQYNLKNLANTGADCLGVDWTTDLSLARELTQDKVALQGNMDPCVLYAKDSVIEEEVKKVIDSFGEGNGHVFNLGHGMQPDMQPEKLEVLVNAVRKFSEK